MSGPPQPAAEQRGSASWGDLAPWEPTTIPRMFFDTAERHGGRVALVTDSRALTYADLARDVRLMTAGLIELGVRKGDKVAVWLPNCPEWIVANLAAAAVGAVTVPLNTRFRGPEVLRTLRAADVSVLVMTATFMTNDYAAILDPLLSVSGGELGRSVTCAELPELRHVLAVEGDPPWAIAYGALLARQPAAGPAGFGELLSAGDTADPVNMFWTSGTTGLPKGAVVSHAPLENIHNYAQITRVTAEDSFLAPTPLFYGTAYYWCMLIAFMHGASLVLLKYFTPTEALAAIRTSGATMAVGIPNTYLGYLEQLDFGAEEVGDASTLRFGWVGGASVTPGLIAKLVDRLRIDSFIQVYGMTETAGITTMTHPDDPPEIAEASIGHPLPGFELRLVDPVTLADVAPGESGELLVRSSMNLLTYYGMPDDELAGYFVEGSWYRTGDLLRQTSDGRYAFQARSKDVLKVGGENVAATEIEAVIYEHAGVFEVAVVGVPDARRSEVPAAVIVVKPEQRLAADEVIEFCRQRLAPFKVPQHVLFVAELPHTPTGKIRKAQVRDDVRAMFAGTS